LLELTQDSKGRFLKLDDGEYLELTQRLKQQLDDLRGYAGGKGKGIQFHPLAAGGIEAIGDDFGAFEVDDAWKRQLQRLHEAKEQVSPVPSTLTAELRDYQQEGFAWLSRLATWGAGACLADDMGLGKTLQALALIVSKAPEGPSLVVAPTSVCANWLDECHRFAPTLTPALFGGGDRESMIEEAGPFDLIVTSYGLMQQSIEHLQEKRWQTLILDEAQAIKNPVTKRSKAVSRLNAEFKIALTGTPVENHLGELWSLFNFLNPGLLGSLQSFNERFAGPIELQQDQVAKQRLKRLVQPFMLRRLKTQVLEELPSRTEIVLHVEMSKEETAFYEAIRQKAVEQFTDVDVPDEKKRFQVLAEITRLRQACCNPNLIAPELGLPSAKQEVLLNVVDELLENRHKALVFSQFVTHLALVRKALDAKGISYQYLDGSTPVKERRVAVDAFQAGEGDLFLISLKAGGTGLNLTAADYVIHLDPWWNPAVEDQASDRAHRIGQQRPVTIYRLVTKATIEDKIVELHKHKRDLADNLLEGAESSARLSTEDILAMLKDAQD
jgi:SNF2 family DNA or RNA helicase